ncbi:MAG: hypothetical protein RR623_01100 [Bacilli bacterium]
MKLLSKLFKKNVVQDKSRNTEKWYLEIKKKEEEAKISDEVLEYSLSVDRELRRRFNLFCYEQYKILYYIEHGSEVVFDKNTLYAKRLCTEFRFFDEDFTCGDWRFERLYSKHPKIYYKDINMLLGVILDTGDYYICSGVSVTFEMIGSE